ncbi:MULTISPECIES: Arc family DNA-binding protein [Acinetobacter]|uniref:Arc family DNA-binding protein n=1 Tax=Acinetobacter chinensis TaxID=2004650 RepID=A0A3B7M0Z8_9GAMM|nr:MULTISPECIES: Arc family DNA-binding protein [Acinetobacter]AXY58045.1 Arc family DNA-binding protein [Acinetobacter chinensis]MDM1770167.1 Arc family DNA-binding protein [Acinetobacter indicus]MDM1772831.1 Arc family DNA-binding protein [Acinetobacter indicus]NWK61061.1 Arc family DNA-binding protein [Acinetobacter sp. SwsAc3]
MLILQDAQLKIRLPSDLKQKIEEVANQEKRSMNAEIVDRLEKSFHFVTLPETNPKNLKLAHYQIIDRKVEVAERLAHSLNLINSFKMNAVKYSHIARMCKYENAEVFLNWLQAKQEPSFTELEKIAAYLYIDQDWLIHGDGHPILSSNWQIENNVDSNINSLFSHVDPVSKQEIEAQKIILVRNISEEGNLLIIKVLQDWRVEVLTTNIHVSTYNGVGGQNMLESFARLCSQLYKSTKYLTRTNAYLINNELFEKILTCEEHPLALLKKEHTSIWWEAFWDATDSNNVRKDFLDVWHDWDQTSSIAINALSKKL